MAKKKMSKKKIKAVKKPKKKKEWQWKGYIFAAARKTFRWSPARKEALAKAKFGEFYRCAHCAKYFDSDYAVDHIQPVVCPTEGFTTWDNYFSRLFCTADNLQVLDKKCHLLKSQDENKTRREVKKKGSK